MILLLDNNEFRRHDIYLSLYMKKYIVAEHALEYMDYYTKPFMTVYINPTTSELEKIKNEDTLCVVAKNNLKFKVPEWMTVIPLDKNTAKEIMRIYDEKCPYGKGRDIIGIIGIEGRKFALGGTYVYLTPKQMKVVKVLLYNREKTFPLYDISSYIDFRTEPEKGFLMMISDLNMKCRNAGRENIIKHHKGQVCICPGVAFY